MTTHAASAASVRVDAVLTGTAVALRGAERSAISKMIVDRPVRVTRLGLEGDEQADLSVHGGPDKAVHHYAFDHYALWRSKAPTHPKLSTAGSFGENISTLGLTETTVCIGDRFRLGTALVEVSQPRQPCWKQAHVMEWTTLPKIMVREAKSGWYYRVIEEGVVAAGDIMTLETRPHPAWSVARAFSLVMHNTASPDLEALSAMARLAVLEKEWRLMAAALCASGLPID